MTSPYVMDVTEANFQREVVDFSDRAPVIIDFWATWCAPCRTLGPTLEKLADEYRGAFRLAKVDVDANPSLAAAVRVQSIPTVVAVFEGGFVDQFVGALPQHEVKRFIDDVLAKAGVSVADNEPKVPSDPAKARQFWRERLDKAPTDTEAKLELGRLELSAGNIDEAKRLFDEIDVTADQYDVAQASLKLLDLFSQVAVAGGERHVRKQLKHNPEDEQAKYLVACADATRADYAEALESLVDIVGKRGDAEVKQSARQAASTILMVAGRDDERVEAQRRRLAALLF